MKNIHTLPKNPRGRVLHFAMIAGATASLFWTSAMAGEARLSVANVSVTEGNSGTTQMNFSVVRSGDSSSNITVPYSVPPGTADPKKDYVRPANNTVLRIPAHATQGIVSVSVNGDTKVEPNETLQLQLGQPTAYSPSGDFPIAPNFAVGSGPGFVQSGDFNGDGRRDLAVSNSVSNNISILLGSGDKGNKFLAARNFSVDANPVAIAVADFDRDGALDLAVINRSGNASFSGIAIWRGDGHGGFVAGTKIALASARVIRTGDFNRDGKPDLLTVNGSVSILLGDGSGGFGAAANVVTGINTFSVTVADLNSDAASDLVLVSNDPSSPTPIAVVLGDGHGSFGSPALFPAGDQPGIDIASGDFNGDGAIDVALTTAGHSVAILSGNGNGGLGGATDFDTGNAPSSIVVADFDGDGKLDIATAPTEFAAEGRTLSVLPGQGDGSFAVARQFSAGLNPVFLDSDDLNRDGKADLVAVNVGSNDVSILLANGAAGISFDAIQNFVASGLPVSVANADFNGDGKSDLAVVASDRPVVSVRLGDGNGGFGSATDFGVGSGPSFVASADFNGDGRADLAVSNRQVRSISILLGNGSGGFGAAKNYRVGELPVAIAIADFNNDGAPDLAVANSGNNRVSILLGRGDGRFGDSVGVNISGSPVSIATADFNGDTRPDLVVAVSDSNVVSLLFGDGSGGFGTPRLVNGGGPANFVTSADLNGDGRPDLAVSLSTIGAVTVLLGSGGGEFAPANQVPVFRAPRSVLAVDLDGDGDRDLIVGSRDDGFVSILPGNGDGSFGTAGLSRNFQIGGSDMRSIGVADFNGDGKRDIVTTNAGNNAVAILLNSPGDTAVLSNSSATGTIVNDD